jgi:hypothetical protein
MIFYLFSTIFVIFLTIKLQAYFKRRKELSILFDNFPSAPRKPFIGHFHLFAGKSPPGMFSSITGIPLSAGGVRGI